METLPAEGARSILSVAVMVRVAFTRIIGGGMEKSFLRSRDGICITAAVWLLLVVAFVAFGSQMLYAQAVAGITGTVTDPSGGVIPNVAVTIRNNATGVVQTTTTSSAGVYAVSGLIPGRYTVTADAPVF